MLKTQGTYPTDWPQIAQRTKDAAAWSCVRCGHEHHIAAGYMMTVHHFDGDKANCEPWNLMPLCQRCHLSVQARVDPDVPLLTEPNLWAMPYIAGFYESGRGMPGPLYHLERWFNLYEQNVGPWPTWAPLESSNT